MTYRHDPLEQDDPQPTDRGRVASRASRLRRRTLAALLLPFLLGAWMMWDGTRAGHGSVPGRTPAPGAIRLAAAHPPAPSLLPLAWSPPTRIRIPAIGVDAPVAPLGLDASGGLTTPDGMNDGNDRNDGNHSNDRNRALVGWYRDGSAPGQIGDALMVGHADLGPMRERLRIDVLRQDGRTAVFSVDAVAACDGADEAQGGRVAGPTHGAELRLVTCDSTVGGAVVQAHLVAAR